MRRAVFFAVFAFVLGCQNSKPTQVARSSPPTVTIETPLNDRLVMRVTDKRPRWEKKTKWDSVSFFALEGVNPPALKLFVNEIERLSKDWASPPRDVHLELQSFRMVVNDPDQMATDREKRRFEPEIEVDESKSFGSQIAQWLFAEIFIMAGNEFHELIASNAYPANPLKYPHGVTCEIRGRLTILLCDGRRFGVELKEYAHLKEWWGSDPEARWEPAIRKTVENTIALCAGKVQYSVENLRRNTP
jgi:hypothetical protein